MNHIYSFSLRTQQLWCFFNFKNRKQSPVNFPLLNGLIGPVVHVPVIPAPLLRYSIHLWDLKHPGTWENKGTYVYYTDFVMELTMLFLDLVHHIHMLVRQCFQLFVSILDFLTTLSASSL